MTDKLKELRRLVEAATPNLEHDETEMDATGARVVYQDDEDSDYDVVGLFTKPADGKAFVALRNAADALIEVAEAARAVRKHLPMTDYTDNQRKNIAVISDTIALDDALRKLEGQDDG